MFFDVTHEGLRHQRSKRRTLGDSIHLFVENPLKLKQLVFGRNFQQFYQVCFSNIKVVLFIEPIEKRNAPPQQAGEIPVRIALPFKDQRSANKPREQLSDLSRKINMEVHNVFKSHKLKDELKAKELKPPIVN